MSGTTNKVFPLMAPAQHGYTEGTSNAVECVKEGIVCKVAERVTLIADDRKKWIPESCPNALSPTTATNILNNNYNAITTEKGEIERHQQKLLLPSSQFPFDLSQTSAKLIEHLTGSIQNEADISEGLSKATLNEATLQSWLNQKMTEFGLEKERLVTKVESLLAENDVLKLNLGATKDRCDALSELMAKHESNDTGLRLLLKYR